MRATPNDRGIERLTELVRSERAALVAVARREGLGPEEALECVQDALCAFVHRDRAPSEHALATLKTMTRNAARNLRRRHHRALPHEAIDDERHASDALLRADDRIAQRQELVRLRVCMAELCSRHRAVITLRLLDERSGEDVAAELGLTRAHVDVLVHRAKAALRVCMEEPPAPSEHDLLGRRAALR